MKALASCFLVLGLAAVTAGCGVISNPFSSSSASDSSVPLQSDVYFDPFSDIPIPRDMSVDRKRSLVSTAQTGLNVGLLTVTGRVELRSLNDAMIHNMSRQGWSLRAATAGAKTMQIYEKGNQYAVIYTYDEMFTTVMEIWGAQRLSDGAYSSPAAGFGGSSFQLDPMPLGSGRALP